MALTGKLYLIPSPLGDGAPEDVLPAPVFQILPQIRRYVVEEVRTARRFLSSAGLRGHIEELEFHTLNEHTSPQEVEALLPLFEDLTVCATNCRRLHDYAMSAGSASAMQVLIASYDHLLPEGEADVMKRILRGRPGPV